MEGYFANVRGVDYGLISALRALDRTFRNFGLFLGVTAEPTGV